MEGISQTTSSIVSVAQTVTENATQTSTQALKSIPTPSAGGFIKAPASDFSIFKAFDPSVFEKAPKEFGNTDPFKDTQIIATSNAPDVHPEKFDFVDFNFLFSNNFTPDTTLDLSQIGKPKIDEVKDLTLQVEPEYDYDFQRLTESFSEPEPISQPITASLPSSAYEAEPEIEARDVATTDSDEVLDAAEATDQKVTKNLSEDSNETDDTNEDPNEPTDLEDETQQIIQEESEDQDKSQQEDPDNSGKPVMIHIVDDEANIARIREAQFAIDALTLETDEVSGSDILELMNKTATQEETSEVLVNTPYTDGSFEETIQAIGEIKLGRYFEIKEKILEIVKNKPALKLAQAGQDVGREAIERVYKYARGNPKGTALDSIHT